MEKGVVGTWCKPDPHEGALMMVIRGLTGMWGRERNAHSGMNCGYWGQTEHHPAFLEPTEGPLPEGEIQHESAQFWSKAGGLWRGRSSPFLAAERTIKGLLPLHLSLLGDPPN